MLSPKAEQTPRSQAARSKTSRSQSLNEPKPPSPRSTSLNRINKLYRGPPTPPPEVQFVRERSFILDCKAVSNISNDYSRANPKLGSVIPPYDPQTDSHSQRYFQSFGVPQTLDKSGQVDSSISLIYSSNLFF